MLHKPFRLSLTFLLLIPLFFTLLPSRPVHALTDQVDRIELPSLDGFIRQVGNGQAGEVRGVYVPGILAAPVVQQPAGMDGFVSPRQNVITQFGLASRVGSTGLLAHNYLAGEAFTKLKEGQEIQLVYGDGEISTFVVTEILRYHALDAYSTTTSFVDLQNQATMNSLDLFHKIYGRPGQVILQTCILANENPSWGRLFVIAAPLD